MNEQVENKEILNINANLQNDQYHLSFVLMPLVKMLAEQQLSWKQREQIAYAMHASMRHHKSMIDEEQTNAGQGQQ